LGPSGGWLFVICLWHFEVDPHEAAIRLKLAMGVHFSRAMALLFTTRFVSAMLHDVSAYDPSTLVGVAGTLVIVTILAAHRGPQGRVDLALLALRAFQRSDDLPTHNLRHG
jgi:hypothetical protein